MKPKKDKLAEIVALHGKWWRGEAGGDRANLADAYLAGAYLAGANLADAYLAGANLADAYLAGANLRGADLDGAYLAGADLDGAYLAGADLDGAYLAGAYLAGANLRGADLDGAYLAGANLADAYLAGVRGNMREVKTAHLDCWPLTWTQPEGGEIILQIGCQRHPLSKWEKSDPRWIAALAPEATEWWGRWRDTVLKMVELAPPVPFAAHKDGGR